jgi:Fe-S cluster assembly protein SufD
MIVTEIETYQDQHVLFQLESAPEWLVGLRRHGMNAFTRLGIPTGRLEDWRFTKLSPLVDRPYKLAALSDPGNSDSGIGASSEEISRLVQHATLDETYHRLVFINGCYSEEWSLPHDVFPGVVVESLARALVGRPDQVQAQLTSGLDFDESAFAALNTAFIEDGALVDIPDGVVLVRPVHLVFLTVGTSPLVSHPRNLIRLGKHSKAQVIESYLGSGEAYFTNAITQVTLDENAQLDHFKLQHEQIGALHIAQIGADQRSSSQFRSHYFSFGASIARNEVNCVLDGEHAEATLNGLYMPTGEQLMDCRSRIDHAQPNCNSHELYKGILDDRARGVFNGKIFVQQDAQKTDAKQSNQALLLSDDAVLNTKPQLEIYADDVRCTHGATIGELEADALNYLRSRGIPNDLARKILVFAFANDVVQGIDLPAVRRHLESVLLSGHVLSEDILSAVEEN